MDSEKRVYRQRFLCLTPKDEEDFSDLLRKNFPGIAFFDSDSMTYKFSLCKHLALAKDHPNICLPEPGWKPKFERRLSAGGIRYRKLVNWPNKRIWYYRAHIVDVDLSGAGQNEGGFVKPVDFRGRRFHTEGQFQGNYCVNDLDKKRFVQKFYRLAASFMTNAYDVYDLKTGKHIETVGRCITWCGPDTIRLCREKDDFVCFVEFRKDLDTWTGYKAIPKS